MKDYFGSDLDVTFCAINNLHLRGSQENIESPNSGRILNLSIIDYYSVYMPNHIVIVRSSLICITKFKNNL